MDRDASVDWVLRDGVDFLDRDSIDFVIDVNTFDVFSISLNDIDEFINVVVSAESYVGIVHLVLVHDVGNHLFVNFGAFDCVVELNTTRLLWMHRNIWLSFVQPNSDGFKLCSKLLFLCLTLLAVEHHQNQVRGLTNTDDLSASTFAVCSTFDNTRKIEKLHFGIINIEYTWDAGQSCELISSGLTLGSTKLV